MRGRFGLEEGQSQVIFASDIYPVQETLDLPPFGTVLRARWVFNPFTTIFAKLHSLLLV